MHEDILGHMAYKIANAEVKTFPFPHIYVENVFPKQFYDSLVESLPPAFQYTGNEAGKYKGRQFYEPKEPIFDPFRTRTFTDICTYPFRAYIAKKWGATFKADTDLRLVLDSENYSIGPHTDAAWKVLSLLFYLPNLTTTEDLGTSIYLPNDPTFTCPGGPHHKHVDFTNIYTAPFRENCLFAFFKTDSSFHGVEPITIPCRRDVLLWNLYGRK